MKIISTYENTKIGDILIYFKSEFTVVDIFPDKEYGHALKIKLNSNPEDSFFNDSIWRFGWLFHKE